MPNWRKIQISPIHIWISSVALQQWPFTSHGQGSSLGSYMEVFCCCCFLVSWHFFKKLIFVCMCMTVQNAVLSLSLCIGYWFVPVLVTVHIHPYFCVFIKKLGLFWCHQTQKIHLFSVYLMEVCLIGIGPYQSPCGFINSRTNTYIRRGSLIWLAW